MNLATLLSTESARLHEFPVAHERIFLAHAGVCPIPRRVAHRIQVYAENSTRGDQETLVPAFQMHELRQIAGQLVGAAPEEIALVGPTSLALSLVAAGLPTRPGDNVVVYLDDYPSNVYPWLALAEHGVHVRFVQTKNLGVIEVDDVLRQVDDRTRLVSLASSHFVSGFCPDIKTIGRALRDRQILFCLDAIQTLGIRPFDCPEVDILAADAHKWLLGPCSAGILMVRQNVQERLRSVVFGWHNVECPHFITQENIRLQPDARRFEAGSANLLGCVGLRAALELIQEIGVPCIAQELRRKREWLVPALIAKGYSVLNAEAAPACTGGILSCYHENLDMSHVHQSLEQKHIITSLRRDRSGRSYLRISPHFYNTDAELRAFLEALPVHS